MNKVSHLLFQVQSLAEEIAHAPISKKKYQVLSRRLDRTLRSLPSDKTSDVFAKKQADALKERIVQLYQDLQNGLVDREISQIREESEALQRGEISKETILSLQKHVAALEDHYRPSLEHRQVLAKAKSNLRDAQAKIEGKELPDHFTLFSREKNVRFVGEYELLPDELDALFDVAKAFYDCDVRTAKSRFNRLPEEYKRLFHEHMRTLLATAFEDRLETLQALLATVNELVGNGDLYPTQGEIDSLFLGLAQLDGMPCVHHDIETARDNE